MSDTQVTQIDSEGRRVPIEQAESAAQVDQPRASYIEPDTQIDPESGERKKMQELGVDPEADVDERGFAEGAVPETEPKPIAADSQISSEDGQRKPMSELGVDPEAETNAIGRVGDEGLEPNSTAEERYGLDEPGGQAQTGGAVDQTGAEQAEGSSTEQEPPDVPAPEEEPVDNGPTKAELYDRAVELNIPGRSNMDKSELSAAIDAMEGQS